MPFGLCLEGLSVKKKKKNSRLDRSRKIALGRPVTVLGGKDWK